MAEMYSARFKGVPRSAEVRAKIGAAHKGRPKSEEVKAKLSAAQKGRVVPEEWKANMRAATRKPFTEEDSKNRLEGLRKACSSETFRENCRKHASKPWSEERKAKGRATRAANKLLKAL